MSMNHELIVGYGGLAGVLIAGWQKICGDYKYYSDFQDLMDGFIKDGDGLQAIASTAEDRAE